MLPPCMRHASTCTHHVATMYAPCLDMYAPCCHHVDTMYAPCMQHVATMCINKINYILITKHCILYNFAYNITFYCNIIYYIGYNIY